MFLSAHQELVVALERVDVLETRPSLTMLVQIHGAEMSQSEERAEIYSKIIRILTLSYYFYFIIQTVLGGGSGDKVRYVEKL